MAKEAEAAAAPKKSKKLLIIIGLVGFSIRSQAVSSRDMDSRRGRRAASGAERLVRGFAVGMATSPACRRVNHVRRRTVNATDGRRCTRAGCVR